MLFFVILRYNYLYPYQGEVPLLLGNNNTNRSIAHTQNNSLRRLLGLPGHNSASAMIINLNIPSLGELLRKYVYSFRNRLETSDNIIIHGIYLSQFLLQFGI